MAQVQASGLAQGRHGFAYRKDVAHDFGRIVAMTTTKNGNLLVCDYNKKEIVLLDETMSVENNIALDGPPHDITFNHFRNTAHVTVPALRTVFEIDPDRLAIMSVNVTRYPYTINSVIIDNTHYHLNMIASDGKFSSLYMHSSFTMADTDGYNEPFCHYDGQGSSILRMRLLNRMFYVTTSTKDTVLLFNKDLQMVNSIAIPTLDIGTDVTSDDNSHLYITGLYSNNVVRITEYGEMLDIPLKADNGIKRPTALCFSNDYRKLYIANDWGRSVKMYDVV